MAIVNEANVVRFPHGEMVDTRPSPRWIVRWWPNSTAAWMSSTVDSVEVATKIGGEKIQEGARKVEVERVSDPKL